MQDDASSTQRGSTRRRRSHRTSASTRLAVAVLVVAITTIVVSVVVATANVSASADRQADTRIETRATSTATELDDYFGRARQHVGFLATSPGIADTAAAFTDAYLELDAIDPDTLVSEGDDLAAFYFEVYLPALEEIRGEPVDPNAFTPSLSGAPIYLQATYLARNPFTGSERRLLTSPRDGSTWTSIHERAHPTLRELADRLGFEDLMLVDAARQDVVYSVAKDTAFATSLSNGPHSDTSLAALVRRVLADPSPGVVVAADAAVYPPAGDRPTIFVAAPVYDDDGVAALVVGSLSLDEVTAIATRDWRDGRFGETGEMYIVGSDQRMRSDARPFLESPGAYLRLIDDLGTVDPLDRQRMESLGTTVLFQPVETEAVENGLAGDTDVIIGRDHLGREVVTSYVPILEDSFDWVLVAQQDRDEAEASGADYLRNVLVITVVFVVALTFVAVAWANGFMMPIRTMSASLRQIRTEGGAMDVEPTGAREFRRLARRLDGMVDALRIQRERVVDAIAAKAAVIRTLMPGAAAEQVRLGQRRLIDTIPQASVVVVVLDGLDDLVPQGTASESREVLHDLVDRLDAAAGSRDLERVKMIGDSYYAVCGLTVPQIDHAPRAADFASEVVEAVGRAASEHDLPVAARAGVASGPVTAGLIGESRLIFDVWGEPVEAAFALAHEAGTGQVLVDESTRLRMPSDARMTAVTRDAGAAWTLEPRRDVGLGR